VLLHHVKHNKVLHEQVVLLSVVTEHVPRVPEAERLDRGKELGQGFFRVNRAQYGFMQTPNVPALAPRCGDAGSRSTSTT
jgi:KUP system potassium uptake protein